MHRTLIRFCVIVATIALVACGPGPDASADEDALPGTTWSVSSIGGVATVGASQPTIIFGADGTVSGTTGCNQYNGTYKLDGSSITISPLASTLMLCEGLVGAQETAFMAAFPKSTGWSVGSDGNLTMTGAADIIASPA